jgi:hypothetical protein
MCTSFIDRFLCSGLLLLCLALRCVQDKAKRKNSMYNKYFALLDDDGEEG